MRILLPLVLGVVSTPALAAPALEDLDALDARIAATVGAGAAQPIDRRLRLLRCPENADISRTASAAVTVACPTKGWRVNVPLIALNTAAPSRGEIVIHRGDTVELAYGGSGFSIVTSAVAAEDGRAGETLRVKTSTSTATVTARVRGPGSASLDD